MAFDAGAPVETYSMIGGYGKKITKTGKEKKRKGKEKKEKEKEKTRKSTIREE